jgi:methylated-DNA-[protein]-cysteine S-methyltransferase
MTPSAQGYCTLATPAGDFSLAVNPGGEVTAAVFGGRTVLSRRLGGRPLREDPEGTAAARREVEDWFGGRLRVFSVRTAPEGTAFQKRVWAALTRIPYGETRSYGELARELGSSARAVGRANATNPVCLIVPCHRVIGADGSLTGYAYGVPTKRALLDMEGR